MRPAVQWSETLVTGISELDEQHHQMFVWLQELDDAITVGAGDRILQVCHGLMHHVLSHNLLEEQLLQEAGYPMLPGHQRQHRQFQLRVERFGERLHAGEDAVRLGREIRSELALWLGQHICREDQHCLPWLQQPAKPGLFGRLLDELFQRLFHSPAAQPRNK